MIQRILVPLDGSPKGEAALTYAMEIAGALKAEVILFRVVESVQFVHSIGGPDRFRYTEQQVDLMKKEAVVYLDAMKKRFDKFTVRTLLATGDAAREILKAAEEEKVSIIAMSAHGHSAIDRWVLGSVSNKVIQAGKTPVLLVRPTGLA